MRYRKKPVVVDAVRVADALSAAKHKWAGVPSWLMSAYEEGSIIFLNDAVHIRTLEGEMRAEQADWIIRGVKGELYSIKDQIFRETYEEATDG